MIKKIFVIVAALAVFASCGNNQQTKKADDKGECKKECTEGSAKECTGETKKCDESAVCIGKVIASPADYTAEEATFNAKVAKCDESGNFFACDQDKKSIEIVPAEGVVLADVVDKVVALTGKVVDGKLQVSAVKVAACCGDKEACSDEKKEGCCSEKGNKEAKASCSGEKKECCGEKKEAKS